MLKKLCEIPSPSGGEDKIKEYIIDELKDYTDLYFEDTFGNLIFIKKGEGESICIECGIDEPFLMLSESKEDILRFSAPPHIKVSQFLDKDACFSDGCSFLIESEKEEDLKAFHIYASSKKAGRIGDYVTLIPYFKKDENSFSAFNIRYKIPAYVIINTVKKIKDNKNELYFVFSVQKCLLNRGVRALMQSGIEFDMAICIESAEDIEEGISVTAKEKSCIPTPWIRKKLLSLARENNIPIRVGITEENYNLKTYLTEGRGVPAGHILIPVRENSVKKDDAKAAEKLIMAICEEGEFKCEE